MQKNPTFPLYGAMVLALWFVASSQAGIVDPTYQGQLLNSNSPVNGLYEFVESLYISPTGGAPAAPPSTNFGVVVSNGNFTMPLLYDSTVFNGAIYYLELAVQTNGGTNPVTLSPRQLITPTPNALFAETSGTAAQVSATGSVPLSALPPQVVTDLSGSTTLSNLTLTGTLNLPNNNGNIGLGNSSLQSNPSGIANTAMGQNTLNSDTTGFANTAVGFLTLANNTTGSYNTAIGTQGLRSNTNGSANTAVGFDALFNNLSGNNNVGIGNSCLLNSLGSDNIALGYAAGYNIVIGTNDIDIGNPGAAGDNNVIRIGSGQTDTYLTGTVHSGAAQFSGTAQFSGSIAAGGNFSPAAALHINGASDSQLRLQDNVYGNHWSIYTEALNGNPSGSGNLLFNTDAGVFAYISKVNGAFASSSDVRLKKDINNLGSVLDRVMQLRPVSYRFKKSDETDPVTDGFLAQDVEPLFPEVVSEVAGYKGIAYTELVPVTVGAIQELNQKLEKKDAEIQDLKKSVEELKAMVQKLSETAGKK